MTSRHGSDEDVLWSEWAEGHSPEKANELVERYMPLVAFHCRRIGAALPKSVRKDDLFSFAVSGLYDAILKFDSSRDLKFDTYASFRIRGAILDGLRKEDWLPRTSREKAKKIEAATAVLEQKLLRSVDPEEVAASLGMPAEDVQTAMAESFFSHMLSIDEQLQDNDSADQAGFVLKDPATKTPEETIVKKELMKELASQITKLTDKEQLVIQLFYKEELTLTEIGEVLGLSTSRISQIHSKALFKLRKYLSSESESI